MPTGKNKSKKIPDKAPKHIDPWVIPGIKAMQKQMRKSAASSG
jgi:hypothetical protein